MVFLIWRKETKHKAYQQFCWCCPCFAKPEEVKPNLSGKQWLGERCLDEAHRKKFRKELVSVWEAYCDKHIARKILRGGDNQKNESLHSIQARLYRKDMPQGDYMSYKYAMAAGVCRMASGFMFVVDLSEKLGLHLPKPATAFCLKRASTFKRQARYKATPHGKKVKSANRGRLDYRLHKQVSGADEGEYLGKGKGLLAKL